MTVTVNAEVENGYEFKGWQEDGETVNESKSSTVAAPTSSARREISALNALPLTVRDTGTAPTSSAV